MWGTSKREKTKRMSKERGKEGGRKRRRRRDTIQERSLAGGRSRTAPHQHNDRAEGLALRLTVDLELRWALGLCSLSSIYQGREAVLGSLGWFETGRTFCLVFLVNRNPFPVPFLKFPLLQKKCPRFFVPELAQPKQSQKPCKNGVLGFMIEVSWWLLPF